MVQNLRLSGYIYAQRELVASYMLCIFHLMKWIWVEREGSEQSHLPWVLEIDNTVNLVQNITSKTLTQLLSSKQTKNIKSYFFPSLLQLQLFFVSRTEK